MIALLMSSLAFAWNVDAQLALGLRAGGAIAVEHPVWRGVVVSGMAYGVRDQYWLAPQLGSFERKQNLRAALLPGVGLRSKVGKQRRAHLFATWHLGPELLRAREEVALPDRGITGSHETTEVIAVSGLRLGWRTPLSDRLSLVTSLFLPTFSGEGSMRLDRVQLGLGLSLAL